MAAKKQQSPLAAVGGLVAAIGGWAIGRYSWASMIVPCVTAGLLILIFTKTPVGPRYFRGAISLCGGHVAWFLVAAVMLRAWGSVILDILLLSAGIAWLWALPGVAPAIFVGCVELILAALNTVSLLNAQVGSVAHRALVIHVLLRVLVVVCLGVGYRRLLREQAEQVAGTTATGAQSSAAVTGERASG